eukprot:m.1082114 g.1082114  ORF g.1082114 m.1082114 type:complete len:310 (-) comp24261_c1_seq45:4799-5728(-)
MKPEEQLLRGTIQNVYDSIGLNDQLGIVVFNRNSKVILQLRQKHSITQADMDTVLAEVLCKSGTYIHGGMICGLSLLENIEVTNSTRDMCILLSDGCNNDSRNEDEEIAAIRSRCTALPNPVIVHTIGFSSEHDAELLHKLSECGLIGVGLYYILRESVEIAASIGDCLGQSENVQGYTIKAAIEYQQDSQWLSTGEEQVVPILFEGETHNFTVCCMGSVESPVTGVRSTVTYSKFGMNMWNNKQITHYMSDDNDGIIADTLSPGAIRVSLCPHLRIREPPVLHSTLALGSTSQSLHGVSHARSHRNKL